MSNSKKTAAGCGNIRKKIIRRGGKEYEYWEARYTVGFDPGTGKQVQKSVSGKTQKEVAQKLKAATAALDDGTYFLLDSVRSRIFAYDYQGNMLYAFGGIGTKSGYFTTPVSIEHHGKDLLVLDSANGMITVMKHTGFGELVANAISAYGVGDYNTSMEYWKQVLVLNGSYELAYRGIGKVLLRNGDYVEALDYLEYAKDYYYYSKAWQSYRKDWIESNILYIVGGLALLAVAYLVYSLITKIRGKVEYYEMWHPSAGTEN